MGCAFPCVVRVAANREEGVWAVPVVQGAGCRALAVVLSCMDWLLVAAGCRAVVHAWGNR